MGSVEKYAERTSQSEKSAPTVLYIPQSACFSAETVFWALHSANTDFSATVQHSIGIINYSSSSNKDCSDQNLRSCGYCDIFFSFGIRLENTLKMRLIQNMSTIAEYPTSECPSSRVIKIAVIGGSGVGKTGKLQLDAFTYDYLLLKRHLWVDASASDLSSGLKNSSVLILLLVLCSTGGEISNEKIHRWLWEKCR